MPSTRCRYLGLIYDSIEMIVELPEDKRSRILSKIWNFERSSACKIRELTKLVGSVGSCCSTLKYGRVHVRSFERIIFVALREFDDKYEAIISSRLPLIDLDWWKQNIPRAVNSVTYFNPVLEIF